MFDFTELSQRANSFRFRSWDLLIIAVCILVGFTIQKRVKNRGRRLPPGPKPLPIIGNVRDFPEGFEATHWASYKELYGSLSSVRAFGTTFIIINDFKIATNLLEKRSMKYAERPVSTFGGKLCGFDMFLSNRPPGEEWRNARKRVHDFIGTRSAMSRFNDLLQLEGRKLLHCLLETPENFVEHYQSYAGAIILKLCFDYSISRKGEDPLVGLGKRVLHIFSDSHSGLWLVDIFPALQYLPEWFPGANFKKVAKQYRSTTSEFIERPFKYVKSCLRGGAGLSFVSTELANTASNAEEQQIKWITASLYGGGSDTTVSALRTFTLAIALHPEVSTEAQSEIDRVVGMDRFPQLSDRPNLPYVDAVLMESLRWNLVAPLGVPRATQEDDYYDGYFIPKGAVIITNAWQICHDPTLYHDPFSFKPERFLRRGARQPEPDPRKLIFGLGRRICPGKEFADDSLFVAMSMMLALLNIERARDSTGKVIVPEVEYSLGIISAPKEFRCSITPRSSTAAALIKTVLSESAYDQDDSADLPE
ncbi:cytochrome P450 oxidoreductase OrdA-like protein [Schizopora paradoxa]|uniref:Cytochrome P450 oxidoreductase OrdA-like protein n=1 Tax=Schizopora paradoxa TaxID=27342 RepID=A0A0H2REI2_9AGAM|nr:cytochrome P450 oxidoreductase OrdA-like protein [Schizopora paradoxa]